MVSLRLILCVTVLWVLTGLISKANSSCPAKHYRYPETHACLRKDSNYHPLDLRNDFPSTSTVVPRYLNDYRSTQAATNMQTMHWNEELAQVARKWTRSCVQPPNSSLDFTIPGSYYVQIIHDWEWYRTWTTISWRQLLKRWYASGGTTLAGTKLPDVMMRATSARVGCAYAWCRTSGRSWMYFTCLFAGNEKFESSSLTNEPYIDGVKGSACPDKNTTQGLCECGGKMCRNGGTLDPNTCECTCLNRPWIKQGGECELDCNEAYEDDSECQRGLTECNKDGAAYKKCPRTCDWCPDCKEKKCFGTETLDRNTCECQCLNKPWINQDEGCTVDCSKAVDSPNCAKQTDAYCGILASIKYEECPIKCGLCLDCGDKKCLGATTLDHDTCECKCIERPWIKQDEGCKMDCSKAVDDPSCDTLPSLLCPFPSVKYGECPNKCGACPETKETTPISPIQTSPIIPIQTSEVPETSVTESTTGWSTESDDLTTDDLKTREYSTTSEPMITAEILTP